MHWRKWMKDCIEIELNWIDLTWFALNWIELNWIELHAWWMNELLNEWLNEGMNEWLNEGMNERVSEWMNEWMNEWINKSINQWINRFADLIFQKCSETLSFFLRFLCEFELSLQSCALIADNFCRSRPAPAERETLLRRPQKPLYLKNTGCRPRVFQAWIHAFQTSYTSQLLDDLLDDDDDDDDDDVVDMMVRMLQMTIIRNLEVI